MTNKDFTETELLILRNSIYEKKKDKDTFESEEEFKKLDNKLKEKLKALC